MASIRSRNSKWQARVNKDDLFIARTFLSRKEAEKWALLTEADIERGEFTHKVEKVTETLGDIFDQYINEVATKHRSATTIININSLKSKLGKVRITEFNARTVASWRDDRLKEVKSASVLRELNTLSAVLNHAKKEWCFQITNPVADIKRPAGGASRTRRLVGDEEIRLIKALRPVHARIVILALASAMRRGEILSLTWRNVDLEKCVAVLPITKNGDVRRVPLSMEALSAIKAQKENTIQPIDGKVFDVHHISLDKAWRRACVKAGISGLHFHDLRHEFSQHTYCSAQELSLVSNASVCTQRFSCCV